MADIHPLKASWPRLCKARRRPMRGMAWLVALAALTACSSEEYDTGDGSLSWLRCDFSVAYTDANLQVSRLVTDDGDTITPRQGVTASWMHTPDSAYRVQAYYDAHNNKVVSLAQVLTLHPVDAGKAPDPKADPLKYESAWVSANGRYLNLGLGVMAGTSRDDGAAMQRLWLLDTGVRTHADGRSTHTYQLCHDQAGVPQYYTVRQYVSVPARDIGADSVSISVPTYSGTHTATLYVGR